MRAFSAVLGVCALVRAALAQSDDEIPSTWPQNYTGIPRGDYSPAWQDCEFPCLIDATISHSHLCLIGTQ